jgi:hypothetical protein
VKYVLVALAVLAAACASKDRFRPDFDARETIGRPAGPVVFAVAPNDDIVYVELRTLDMFRLRSGEEAQLLGRLTTKPDSLAVNRAGVIFAAGRDRQRRLTIWRPQVAGKVDPATRGPASRFPVHIKSAGGDTLIVGHSRNVYSLRVGQPFADRTPISSGWTDPVIALGRGTRIWVADNGLPGSKERAARGRERDVAKRNRFASDLPPDTNPTDAVVYDDELLLCSRTHKKVYRLHIGIDDVARRRDWLAPLVCDRNIGVTRDGALITAQTDAIYRYPPR